MALLVGDLVCMEHFSVKIWSWSLIVHAVKPIFHLTLYNIISSCSV